MSSPQHQTHLFRIRGRVPSRRSLSNLISHRGHPSTRTKGAHNVISFSEWDPWIKWTTISQYSSVRKKGLTGTHGGEKGRKTTQCLCLQRLSPAKAPVLALPPG
ncbi:hypothetical protein CDAR_122811 [Caerostris darwini]|uniref:Uncharacterized protein n=1 Tax=Caerostris darwini TaxID=1538125 RepID=A0AAV4UY83_9ARAC|nr:hypothetical protein CDAR_122811 [Caerostris darwini]